MSFGKKWWSDGTEKYYPWPIIHLMRFLKFNSKKNMLTGEPVPSLKNLKKLVMDGQCRLGEGSDEVVRIREKFEEVRKFCEVRGVEVEVKLEFVDEFQVMLGPR